MNRKRVKAEACWLSLSTLPLTQAAFSAKGPEVAFATQRLVASSSSSCCCCCCCFLCCYRLPLLPRIHTLSIRPSRLPPRLVEFSVRAVLLRRWTNRHRRDEPLGEDSHEALGRDGLDWVGLGWVGLGWLALMCCATVHFKPCD